MTRDLPFLPRLGHLERTIKKFESSADAFTHSLRLLADTSRERDPVETPINAA